MRRMMRRAVSSTTTSTAAHETWPTSSPGCARCSSKAGVPVVGDLAVAVADFRQACEARRTHDEARRRLADLQRSARSLGGDGVALESLELDLADQLRQRGGDPEAALASPPPDAASLQQLDLDAERARRAATSASDQARELRARLGGVLDTLPVIADLEDERDSCAAARERGLRQLKALRLASDMIESAVAGHASRACPTPCSVARQPAQPADRRAIHGRQRRHRPFRARTARPDASGHGAARRRVARDP